MPKLSLFPNGCTAGFPPGNTDAPKALRSEVSGWSPKSCRANTRFLYSVDSKLLDGHAVAATLTLKHCPPDSTSWHRLLSILMKRLRRLGLVRGHWVTEWQRRGVPHLHCALYFTHDNGQPTHTGRDGEAARVWRLPVTLAAIWCDIASEYGPKPSAQHITPITDAVGWFGYVSKHAARGVSHYQRNPENIPPAWQKKTGRVWGKVGTWPTRDAVELELSSDAFWRFRRLVRGWRKADARSSGELRRFLSARRMLTCNKPNLSPVRGVSEWLDLDKALMFVATVAALGGEIQDYQSARTPAG